MPKRRSAPVPKCLSTLGVKRTKFPSAPWASAECPNALQVPWLFECSLRVLKCTMRVRMSDQIWLKQNTKFEKMIYIYEQRQKWLKRFWGAYFWSRTRALFRKAFEIGYTQLIFPCSNSAIKTLEKRCETFLLLTLNIFDTFFLVFLLLTLNK